MKSLTSLIATLALAASAHAHEYDLGALHIGHPYARATAPGQPTGGGFLSIANKGATADRLVSVSADVSKTVELHTMKMEGDVMRMRQVDGIEVPAGQTVKLEPGAFHVMFLGLKAPLKAGDRFPATLKFEKAGEVRVDLVVQAPGAPGDAASGAMHRH